MLAQARSASGEPILGLDGRWVRESAVQNALVLLGQMTKPSVSALAALMPHCPPPGHSTWQQHMAYDSQRVSCQSSLILLATLIARSHLPVCDRPHMDGRSELAARQPREMQGSYLTQRRKDAQEVTRNQRTANSLIIPPCSVDKVRIIVEEAIHRREELLCQLRHPLTPAAFVQDPDVDESVGRSRWYTPS